MGTSETDLLNDLKATFNIKGKIQRERRVWMSVEEKKLLDICTWLKDHGFTHLSSISVTDWLDEGTYELTYHLWSYTEKILLTVKTKIDREKPSIASVLTLWNESAQIHERELHELFGVDFLGNPDLAPLFLENWSELPPFKKDFNWRTYVQGNYYHKENERELVYYD